MSVKIIKTLKIKSDSTVSMHLDIRLKDGSIADSTRNIGRPMKFKMGEGNFSEKLERGLLELSPGDKKKIMLLPKEAFGEAHPANIYHMPKSQLARMKESYEVGSIIIFTQPNGKELPGIIRAIDHPEDPNKGEVEVDFNHPLAGQVVLFDIEIIEIY